MCVWWCRHSPVALHRSNTNYSLPHTQADIHATNNEAKRRRRGGCFFSYRRFSHPCTLQPASYPSNAVLSIPNPLCSFPLVEGKHEFSSFSSKKMKDNKFNNAVGTKRGASLTIYRHIDRRSVGRGELPAEQLLNPYWFSTTMNARDHYHMTES